MAVPSSSFAPPSRAGFAAGRTVPQVVVAMGAVMVLLLPLLAGASPLSARSVVCVFVMAFALTNVGGESLMGLLGRVLGFRAREALGWTRWTASPMAAGVTVGVLDLPGANGSRTKPLRVVGTRYDGACFLWDRVSGEATACLLMGGTQWRYTSDGAKTSRAAGWARAMEQISALEGVSRVVTQARCLPAASARSRRAAGGLAGRDLEYVESGPLAVTSCPDMVLSVTVSTDAIRGRIGRLGGGVEGLSVALADLVPRIVAAAQDAGADPSSVRWLTLPELRGQARRLCSRDALDVLDASGGLSDQIPMVTSVAEYDRRVRVGDVWAASLWIDQWPSSPVAAGWLEDALCTGFGTAQSGARMVLSLAWRGVDEERATRQLDRRIGELQNQTLLRARIGQPIPDRTVNELADSRQRKAELARGMSATAFKGVVTLVADDPAGLEDAVTVACRSLGAHDMHADRYYGRQWALFCDALPFGMLGRGGW